MGCCGESEDYSKRLNRRDCLKSDRDGGTLMRDVKKTRKAEDAEKQIQNDSAIGELSIMLAQMQEQNDSAIGELSIMLAQIMGGTTE